MKQLLCRARYIGPQAGLELLFNSSIANDLPFVKSKSDGAALYDMKAGKRYFFF
jgi:hypothetical protein